MKVKMVKVHCYQDKRTGKVAMFLPSVHWTCESRCLNRTIPWKILLEKLSRLFKDTLRLSEKKNQVSPECFLRLKKDYPITQFQYGLMVHPYVGHGTWLVWHTSVSCGTLYVWYKTLQIQKGITITYCNIEVIAVCLTVLSLIISIGISFA